MVDKLTLISRNETEPVTWNGAGSKNCALNTIEILEVGSLAVDIHIVVLRPYLLQSKSNHFCLVTIEKLFSYP